LKISIASIVFKHFELIRANKMAKVLKTNTSELGYSSVNLPTMVGFAYTVIFTG